MEKWYKNRMRKEQLDKKPAKSLDLMQLVQYDQIQVRNIFESLASNCSPSLETMGTTRVLIII
jgi:hypothetical protein